MELKPKFKQRNLAKKLTIRLIVGMFLVFLLLITAISNSIKSDLVVREAEKLVFLAKENATIAKQFMETMINKQGVIVASINNIEKANDDIKSKFISQLLTSVKNEEKNILSVFFATEPNAFISNTPNGFSVFATESGTATESDQFKYINKTLYEQAKSTNTLTILDPAEKTIDGKNYLVITVIQPVYDSNNKLLGMLGSNIDTALLNTASYNNGGFKTFTNQVICGHQTIITHSSRPETIGENFEDITVSTNPNLILDSVESPEPFTFLDIDKDGDKNYRAFIPFYIGTSKVVWLSGTSISKAEFDEKIIKQVATMSVIAILGLIGLTVFAYILINRALKPIKALEVAAKKMSDGELDIQITHTSNDELGSLAQSYRDSVLTLSTYIQDIDRAMSEFASGNFEVSPSQPFKGDFYNIEKSITTFIITMSKALNQINLSSEQVSISAETVASGSEEMSQGSAEQASSVETLLQTVKIISTQVDNNAKNAIEASKRALDVGGEIEHGNQQMEEMVIAMNHIIHSSEEIKKIIKTIDDIAFQTNILALNASVEAARAGLAGKGFAVVADEVRNLAGKSAEAAKNTSAMIQASIEAVQTGSRLANETSKSLTGIVSGAREMVTIIDGIAKASTEQAASIVDISDSVNQISAVISNNSATAEESASSSEELSEQAQSLKQLIKQFNYKKFD